METKLKKPTKTHIPIRDMPHGNFSKLPLNLLILVDFKDFVAMVTIPTPTNGTPLRDLQLHPGKDAPPAH